MIKIRIIQGKDYPSNHSNLRLNDYHVVWYLFGKYPISSIWIKGLDDWAKDNSFKGMTLIKWDGTEEKIK